MAMNTEQARFNMIEQQIRPWDVLDLHVLELLARVRREDFVPPAYQALAFVDAEVPIGHGQVMLAPKVEARLLQEAQVQRHERVLEIGAGSGFMAALLAHRARSVIALERIGALATQAAANLRRGGVLNASVREMDGAAGLPGDAPFDVIMLSGSVAEVPQVLLDQLKPGGRLFAIVGDAPVMEARLVTCNAPGAFQSTVLFETCTAPLVNAAQPKRFSF
jgi:protein-L-isoaspartate(D-aspartate) O-methyltransferase